MQRCKRRCANEYWPELCGSIHSAVETGIIKAICTMKSSGLLVLLRKKKEIAPLTFATGEVIPDRAQQVERWVEYYAELSTRENMVSLEALNAIGHSPVLEDLDSEPTKVELKEALRHLQLEKRAARMVILCLR